MNNKLYAKKLKAKAALLNKQDQPILLEVKSNMNYFKKFLFELIEKLAVVFPDHVDEYIITQLKESFEDIKNDDSELYQATKEVRSKSPLAKYMVKFYNNLYDIKNQINDKILEIFDTGKRIDYNGPINVLYNCEIDFYKLWELEDIDINTKQIIFTYLRLMIQNAEKLISHFEISDKNRQMVESLQTNRNFRKKELKKKIAEMVGGSNQTVDTIVDDVLLEFDKRKSHFKPGNTNPKKIMELVKSVHSNLTARYEEGGLDEDEIAETAEKMFDNIMKNNTDDMKDNLGDIVEMMKQTGLGGDVDIEKVREFVDKGENPFRQQKESKDSKGSKTPEESSETKK